MVKKCRFRKKNGSLCAADAQTGKEVCIFHDPEQSANLTRGRRAGGINRSRAAAVLPAEIRDHPLGTTKDVSSLLADSINQVRRGQLEPRVANAVGYLTSVLLRALEQGPLEERMAKLEATLDLAQSAQTDPGGTQSGNS